MRKLKLSEKHSEHWTLFYGYPNLGNNFTKMSKVKQILKVCWSTSPLNRDLAALTNFFGNNCFMIDCLHRCNHKSSRLSCFKVCKTLDSAWHCFLSKDHILIISFVYFRSIVERIGESRVPVLREQLFLVLGSRKSPQIWLIRIRIGQKVAAKVGKSTVKFPQRSIILWSVRETFCAFYRLRR